MPLYPDQAPLGKRALAGAIDSVSAFALYWSVVNADLPVVEEQFLALVVACFVVAVIASSSVLPGQSPGKYVARLMILTADAGELVRRRQIARDLSRPLIAFFLSFGFIVAGVRTLEQGFALALGCIAAAELMCLSTRSDNRSIADLVFKTRVVRLPPPQPHRAPAGPMYSATDAEFGKPARAPKRDA